MTPNRRREGRKEGRDATDQNYKEKRVRQTDEGCLVDG